MQDSHPDHVAAVAALWPYVKVERVGASQPAARLLPASRGRCGLYVLRFADGALQVGRATDVVTRFAALCRSENDLVEMHFWRFAKAGLDSAEQSAIGVLRQAGFRLRDTGNGLDDLLAPAGQLAWLTSPPADTVGAGARPDRPELRAANLPKFRTLQADPRFGALLPAVRRYLARTMPPRRTEFSRWSVSARPATNEHAWPRLLTVSVNCLETLYAGAPAGEPHRTIFHVNVDLAVMQRQWGADVEELAERFGAVYYYQAGYRARPGVLALQVEGARNLIRLLDVPGVVEAARRLNLDMMRKGPALQRRSHSFALADLLLEPVPPADAPADADAFQQGELCAERGEHEQAELWYARAAATGYQGVRRNPDWSSIWALIAWGRQFAADGDLPSAASCYESAADAGATEAYLDLGDTRLELGETGDAAAAFRTAAACGHHAGWHGLGLVHHERGELRQARRHYLRAVDFGQTQALVDLADCHAELGETEQAAGCYREAIAAGHTDAHLSLGDLLHQRGDDDGAEQQFRHAAAAGHPEAVTRLGRLFYDRGDLDAAEPLLRAASDDPEAAHLLDRLLRRRSDIPAAPDLLAAA